MATPPARPVSSLTALRLRAGLTRRALGDLVGVSDRTIARYEADTTALPCHRAITLALALQRRLGHPVEPQWLYLPVGAWWRGEPGGPTEVGRKEVTRRIGR